MSLGLVVIDGSDDVTDVLSAADEAMYRAKTGRKRHSADLALAAGGSPTEAVRLADGEVG